MALIAVIVIAHNHQQPVVTSPHTGVSFRQVDDYKRNMRKKHLLDKKRVQTENYTNAPQLDGTYRAPELSDDHRGIDLRSQIHHAPKDIGAERRKEAPTFSPEAQVDKLLAAKQAYDEMSKLQKKRYAREFKREARRLGFRVELNDRLEVIQFSRVPASRESASDDDLVQGQEFY